MQTPLPGPLGNTQGVPAQQSACVVQAPIEGIQFVPAHSRAPVGPGVQGLPQQSALEAQAVPGGGGGEIAQSTAGLAVQRGTPSASCWQRSGFCCTVPEQHRSVALQLLVASRQTAPAGLQRLPLSQRATRSPGFRVHSTRASVPSGRVAEPQQSTWFRQISPVPRQPLKGWQTLRPDGAKTWQLLLQQSPPQLAPVLTQSTPDGVQPPLGGGAQIPRVAPGALLHAPVQHWAESEHTSPACVQNEESAQMRPLHSLEQQSPSAAHGFPVVLHVGLRGVQVPPVGPTRQVPLQHSLLSAQACLSPTHWVPAQVPALHREVQQSVPAAQAPPAGVQGGPMGIAHFWATGSQLTVQHSTLEAQLSPTALHTKPSGRLPSGNVPSGNVLS